jgi:hypothetical protein
MQEPDRSRLMQISYANEKEMHHTSVLLADGWDDPSYHPYLTSRMIPEGPRLDFYKGKI